MLFRSSFKDADEVRPYWNGTRGDLYLASLSGRPLAAVALNYEGADAYYTASVSIDHGDVPGTHWPLWHAILEAKKKEIRTLHLGYLELGSSFGDKKLAIANFKRGFTEQFSRHIWWFVNIHSRAPT